LTRLWLPLPFPTTLDTRPQEENEKRLKKTSSSGHQKALGCDAWCVSPQAIDGFSVCWKSNGVSTNLRNKTGSWSAVASGVKRLILSASGVKRGSSLQLNGNQAKFGRQQRTHN
jgi:hypothetical protein